MEMVEMTDPAEYKNNWMKYATAEEIDAHFKALEAREEEIRKSRFGTAMDLTAKLLSDQGKSRDEQTGELAYFGSTRVGYEYYDACRVIYRLGVEAEDMWREVQGRKDPTEDLLERLKNQEYRAESERKDEVIFNRLKRAVDEEVADRPAGNTMSISGGLKYIFNINHILENDPWSRHVQGRLTQMNQWTNAMMYAYDKILWKLSRMNWGSFNAVIKHHDNFRNHGYWDNGEYVALETQIEKYLKAE